MKKLWILSFAFMEMAAVGCESSKTELEEQILSRKGESAMFEPDLRYLGEWIHYDSLLDKNTYLRIYPHAGGHLMEVTYENIRGDEKTKKIPLHHGWDERPYFKNGSVEVKVVYDGQRDRLMIPGVGHFQRPQISENTVNIEQEEFQRD